jgi:2-keto-4-pentenoate hydratase/2-oxohepta-3-ene-1,7-dioic acid hydratase in catechol pathway
MPTLQFQVAGGGPLALDVQRLIIAGWTGRDKDAVQHHIEELQAIGVKPPASVPCFYPLAASLLTTADVLEVPRDDSSGEIEVVLLQAADALYVGVGSDHTDRKVEAYDVTVSKQMCDKPVGKEVWRFDDVADHWDSLEMRCWRVRDGKRSLYQEGKVTRLLDPRELIRRLTGEAALPPGTAMFCGTQAVIGELGHGEAFEVELHDPVRNLTLRHAYRVQSLAVAE